MKSWHINPRGLGEIRSLDGEVFHYRNHWSVSVTLKVKFIEWYNMIPYKNAMLKGFSIYSLYLKKLLSDQTDCYRIWSYWRKCLRMSHGCKLVKQILSFNCISFLTSILGVGSTKNLLYELSIFDVSVDIFVCFGKFDDIINIFIF